MAVRIRESQLRPKVPEDLPERFYTPVIALDPEADSSTRSYQAYESFYRYQYELSDWLRGNQHQDVRTLDVMQELGTTLSDFLAVARDVSADQEAAKAD